MSETPQVPNPLEKNASMARALSEKCGTFYMVSSPAVIVLLQCYSATTVEPA